MTRQFPEHAVSQTLKRAMKLGTIFGKIGDTVGFSRAKQGEVAAPPTLGAPTRFPYGPFRFEARLTKGVLFEIQASTDLTRWLAILKGTASGPSLEHVDSEASKFSYRFYRVLADGVCSTNVIGYASTTLPPGFSMIANPLNAPNNTVAELFKDWPGGTTLSKFDTRLFCLTDNGVKNKAWTNPHDKLLPGEGAIFFNPTPDYRPLIFVGEVTQGNLSMPIPAGFSVRSSLVPQAGQLEEDLHFPIGEGDVIHLFDRDRKKYVLYPYENGKWTNGAPVVSVGESFWVAKTEAANWVRNFFVTAEATVA
jgi:hypothetical protein